LSPIPVNQLDFKFRDKIIGQVEGENLKHCLGCGTCSAGCFVREVDKRFNPRKIGHMVLLGAKDYFKENPEIPYLCNLCGLCQETCPYGLNIGDLCLALRAQLVEDGIGPLPKHQSMKEEQEFVLTPSFTLSLPDPDSSECKRVFFPGCNLSAYSPSVVIATWDYLRAKLPGTGIILRCCGALSYDLGLYPQFQQISQELENEVHKLGASELITGCPECYDTIKRVAPHYKLRSLYEVMAEVGIPDLPKGSGQTFTLHDSCKTRWETGIQDSVRDLVAHMGYQIEEMRYSRELTRCCGQGGLIVGINPFLVFNLTKSRLTESHFDMLTYCAACRETFAMHKPTLHILDLMFNPNWEKDKARPINKTAVRRENQALLKSLLTERLKTS